MKKNFNKLLEAIPGALPPAIPFDQVQAWAREGRSRKRLHVRVWLSRVWRWSNN